MEKANKRPITEYATRNTQVVTQLRDRLLARPEITFAYLHGSFVEGLPYHDIDVAVYLDSSWAGDVFDYEMSLSTELTLALHVMVDIHGLNGAPLGFCHSVLQGEVLFARDEEALADYIERVSLDYMDFEHLARAYTHEVALP
jgi:predicted nucleotidyltransferase